MKSILNMRIFFVFIFLFVLSFFIPQTTLAHILKYDGSIGAVLHVNPEDDPIAGEPTGFFFEFKDKNNKFLPENCDCLIKITKSGNETYTQDLFKDNVSPSLTNATFTYIFPTIGIYEVIVVGTPKDESFSQFTLKYDVRVARTVYNDTSTAPDENWWQTHIWHVTASILIALATLVVYIRSNKKNDK